MTAFAKAVKPRALLSRTTSRIWCFTIDRNGAIYITNWQVNFTERFILPFHTVHGVLKARILKWFAIPFSSGLHFVRTLYLDRWSWVALHGMAHKIIELDKVVVHVINLVSFLWLWLSFHLPSDGWGWDLWKLSEARDWLLEKLGLALVGGAMLSKSLIQLSADGWGCVPSL